jgi:hypothetical protein
LKILLFIIGIVVTVSGLGITIYGWHTASTLGRIYEGLAYSGPVLLVLGAWRVLGSLMAARLPVVFRLIAGGVAFGAGYGNTSLLKATFPEDKFIATNTSH